MKDLVAIKIKDLHKYYGKVHALRGVSLQVKRGEIFGFLGPNGAGKTTTIRCMLDLIRPQYGSIEILGINPQRQPVEVRSKIGYLPGELRMEGNDTVRDSLKYFAGLRQNNVNWSYVSELTKKIELDLDITVKNLSKGNKQKLGVVQALMAQPKILLMDEPTSGLDPLMQQTVYKLLMEAKSRGATVFFSSHIISEVEAIADRVAIIRKGVITEEVNPSQLASMTIRRVKISLRDQVDIKPLVSLKGISLVSNGDGKEFTLRVEGDMDMLIKTLARFPVRNIDVLHPSLEEVFLAYYRNEAKEVA